jgi:WhiB family redox-sensing transcriptional regulator
MTDVQLTGWRQRAKCAGLDTELFYPEPATGAAKRAAKAVCARCDVKLECLLDALATSEQFGIRGGLTARERRTMTRRLREQHARDLIRGTRSLRPAPLCTVSVPAARVTIVNESRGVTGRQRQS